MKFQNPTEFVGILKVSICACEHKCDLRARNQLLPNFHIDATHIGTCDMREPTVLSNILISIRRSIYLQFALLSIYISIKLIVQQIFLYFDINKKFEDETAL